MIRKQTRHLNLFTNNEVIQAQTVADLYRYLWKVILFFKWFAISVYVMIAIIKKQLKIEAELFTILQVLRLTLFGNIIRTITCE